MENIDTRSFVDELFVISVARVAIPEFEQRARAWMYANGACPVHPSDSTHCLISRLGDHWLSRLAEHAGKALDERGLPHA